ncbi:MAG TPA: DUF6468 domain-containing protein [Stellaceae bacterium]|nr:DUF6468 domain-containing protein [Stellaceae bacterium]
MNALRRDKVALKALVTQLADASASAEAGVAGLRAAAHEIGRTLEKKLQDAQSLRDDLVYMIERGGTTADRLEGTIRTRREAATPEAAHPAQPERSRATPAPAPKQLRSEPAAAAAAKFVEQMAQRLAPAAPSRAERQLLRALGGRR